MPIGVPASSSYGFNLGVEIGQITFIAVVLGVVYVGRQLVASGAPERAAAWLLQHKRLLSAYGLGIPAAFWFIQRLGAF